MAKLTPSDRKVVFYEQLGDIINDVPADILNSDGEAEEDTDTEGEDEETEDKTKAEEDEGGESEEDENKEGDEGEDDDDDDYFTTSDEDEEEEPKKPVASTPAPPAAVTQDDESQFILKNLSKIPVNIVVEGTDGKEVIQRVEVYGFGDLPHNFKGYANPLEGEQFRGAVAAQEIKAQRLQDQYRTNKQTEQTQAQQAEYAKRENRAIAEDLTELRREGLFPKFKGSPGTKEFNESDGAKEFDRVISFMNKKNDDYLKRANEGKAYRHIGFREAYEMLNGQNPKAKEQAEDKARKTIAGKVKSKGGAKATNVVKTGAARVNSMTDLAEEFNASVSS